MINVASPSSETLTEVEHPGVELQHELDKRNMLGSALADESGLSRPLISQITNGNRRITVTSANKICSVIGGDPMHWIKKQRDYDLYLQTPEVETPEVESV